MNVEEITKKLEEHEKRISRLEGQNRNKIRQPEEKHKNQSIGEFLSEVKPDGYIEKTLACGYYLEERRLMDCFTNEDIESIFREAREPVSTSISRDISRAIKKGWIMVHDEKKNNKTAFRITSKGAQAIHSKFTIGKERK